MKVLIIEDQPTDRKLMGAVLRMSGHLVRERACAEEARDAIAADKPDVILLDVRLPGMDGLALSRLLKSNEGTRDIPIVAVTAYPDQYTQEELIAAGCETCIVKPINTRGFNRTLEEAAGKKP
jgi:CheY-like chemotaxis protein